ncbi:MAG: hypothetical protein E7417_04635 [Ruminococcaceae bacterium]|nr:hypothetical protein [Oscillospiraceae bacterium]
MADMMSTLRGILGDGADEKIKNAMDILSSGGISSEKTESKPDINSGNGINLTPESLEMISQIKGMFDRISTTNDSRSELLRSLRPFVRSERQKSIDKAIRLINIGRFSGIIGK